MIQPLKTWVSPMVLVKKDRDLRVCVDYRFLKESDQQVLVSLCTVVVVENFLLEKMYQRVAVYCILEWQDYSGVPIKLTAS